MVDQKAFMETLSAVQEVARASEGPLKREEVLFYFKDMDLSKEQEELEKQQAEEEFKEELEKIFIQNQDYKSLFVTILSL